WTPARRRQLTAAAHAAQQTLDKRQAHAKELGHRTAAIDPGVCNA
ncbi:MAG: hypothetical protein JWP96_1975, partial [Polaromonas sp.]|nr:hypothetical protein [Polaromonas sp.]